MALLKYFTIMKMSLRPNSAASTVLPDPNGPLCKSIGSNIIEKTNKEVEAVIHTFAQVSQVRHTYVSIYKNQQFQLA